MAFPIQVGLELRQFPLLPASDADLLLLTAFAQATPGGQGAFICWNLPLAVRTGRGAAIRYQPLLSTSLAAFAILATISLVLRRRTSRPGRARD